MKEDFNILVAGLATILIILVILLSFYIVDTVQERKMFDYLDSNHRRCRCCGALQHRMYPEMELWAGSKTECVCKRYLT